MKLFLSMFLLGSSLCLSMAQVEIDEFCVSSIDVTANIICGGYCILTKCNSDSVVEMPDFSYIYNFTGSCIDGTRYCGQACLSMRNENKPIMQTTPAPTLPPTTIPPVAAIPAIAKWMTVFPMQSSSVVGNVRIVLYCSVGPQYGDVTWATAQSYCQGVGYQLGQFTNQALTNAIMQMANSSNVNDYLTNGCRYPWVGAAYDTVSQKYNWTATRQPVAGPFLGGVLSYTVNRPNLYWNGYAKALNNYDLVHNQGPIMGFACTSQ